MSEKKSALLLSGIKPTGKLHIGNYFGAMRQFLDYQNTYSENFIFIADLHALTTVHSKSEMEENILGVAIGYLAIGLDPAKVTLYKQSDVPQVAELAWMFNCLTTMPYLMRAHAFKDAEAKNKEINVGIFDYPILMAADILIQDATVVPVGLDQKQHVEIARDTAEKFNNAFGTTFILPDVMLKETVKTVPGTDGRKMSKSYNNTIGLFASDEEIEKAVMGIPTDSKGVEEPKEPNDSNLFALHRIFSTDKLPDLEHRYRIGGIGYKESKEILIEDIRNFIRPIRETKEELEKDKGYIVDVLKRGGEKAKVRAEAKMDVVRERIGVRI